MKLNPKFIILLGSFFLFLAVAIGAFGAHGLEGALSTKSMATFKTGSQYHFYHGFALILSGIIQHVMQELNMEKIALSFTMGILFFSFNCYLYAITGIKAFAMIVPIGGIFFLMGWFLLSFKIYRIIK